IVWYQCVFHMERVLPMNTHNLRLTTLSHRHSLMAGLLAGLLILVAPATLFADGVKISKFWIDNVEIQDISNGQIVYINNLGSEITKPLSELEGIRVADVPELERALGNFE